jgi:hypothetical protein
MKKNVSQINFAHDNSNQMSVKASDLPGRSSSKISHIEEPIAAQDKKATKFYYKSDIFNISGPNQIPQKTKPLEHLKSDIFFEKSENQKFITKSNNDLSQFDRHNNEFIWKLKKLNRGTAFDRTSFVESTGLNFYDNKIENNGGIKISLNSKTSARDLRLERKNIRIHSFDNQDYSYKHTDVNLEDRGAKSKHLIYSKVRNSKSMIFGESEEEPGNQKYKPLRKQFIKDNHGLIKQSENGKECSNNFKGKIANANLNKSGDGNIRAYEIKDIENFSSFKISEIKKEFNRKG